jgi:TonB-dependent receptor
MQTVNIISAVVRPCARPLIPGLAFILGFAAAAPAAADSPPAPPGAITGRVLDKATGDYLRNADIRLAGPRATASQITASEDGGEYRLGDVPPGEATVVVSYTGYKTITATVRVEPGATVTRDFELAGTGARPARAEGGEVVKLDTFVVSGHREGDAKALMDQRKSMDIKSSLSSDSFGDIAEDNIGEFLKNMAGIDTDSEDGTARYISIRGMEPDMTAVTVDGVGMAAADANATDADSRSFSFEQVSLSSIESIEVFKTAGADMDANAPAGTINIRTKRAFNHKGRRIQLQASMTANSEFLSMDRTPGPGDELTRKIKPSAKLEYSDVFFDKKLGVSFSIAESNRYINRTPVRATYSYAPTVASVYPVTLTEISGHQIQQSTLRRSAALTFDYRPTRALTLGLTTQYNESEIWSGQRSATLVTGDRAYPVSGDPLFNFETTHPGANINMESLGVAKRGEGWVIKPDFEYKRKNLAVAGRFALSHSTSHYDPLGWHGSVYSAGSMQLRQVPFSAKRSSSGLMDWEITQKAGSDWHDGANHGAATLLTGDGRYASHRIGSGDVSATLKTSKWLPVTWKAGVKAKRESWDKRNERNAYKYTYTGPADPSADPSAPLPGAGQWADYRSPVTLDLDNVGFSIKSISGQSPWMPDLMKIGRLYQEHPDYFTHIFTSSDYFSAYIGNRLHYEEDVDAAFIQATTRIGSRLTLKAGLRHEDTRTTSREPDPLSPDEMRAAGQPVNDAGRGSTIDAIKYQYESRPNINRTGNYDNFFPSASIKYELTPDTSLHLGFARTIRRPRLTDVSGVAIVDESNHTVAAKNASLRPQVSDNLSLRIARYFEPVGEVAVNFYQYNIKGLWQTRGETADPDNPDYGEYDGYRINSVWNRPGTSIYRGMELEYRQQLDFLPHPFQGMGVRASYTRNYIKHTLVRRMAPHLVSAGLSYSLHRLKLNVNWKWAGDTPRDSTGTLWQRARSQLDAGGAIKIGRRTALFFSVANILDDPYIRYEKDLAPAPVLTPPLPGGVYDVSITQRPQIIYYQKYGVTTTIGIRTTF